MQITKSIIAGYVAEAERRKRRPRGIASYVEVLRQVATHLDGQSLTPESFAGYVSHRAPTLSATTITYHCAVVNSLQQWARKSGLLSAEVNLLALVERPRRRRVEPKRATALAIRKLRRWLKETRPRTRREWRVRAIVALALYAGLRISEIANLRWEEVDLEGNELVVREGKGGHDRTVPICRPLAAILAASEVMAGTVFGFRNQPSHPKSLSHVFYRDIPREVGVEVSPHMLRRAFATDLDERGVSLRVIQELLGHADVSTTERYIGVTSARKREAVTALDAHWSDEG